MFENNDDLANDILVLSDAYERKKKGAEADTSEEWLQQCDKVMADVIREKFTQSNEMLSPAEYRILNTL